MGSSPDGTMEEYKGGNWQINTDNVVTLHALRVHPEYSGKGYAKKLMNHSLIVSKEKGFKVMRLDVMKGNDKPIGIYKKYGFEECGEVLITYPDIGYPMPCVLMELDLEKI